MDQIIFAIFKSARPRQWLKNFSLFTAIIFSGWLFIPEKFYQVLLGFFVYCFTTSAVYIFNDIIDAPQDRLHPLKKKRPIASGVLPLPIALFSAILLTVISLVLAINISFFFFLLNLTYIVLHFAYSLWIKHVPILDIMAIASGFIIRVYAGAVAINAHINAWLLLCIISFSLFLAIGKRRSEKTLLDSVDPRAKRRVLSHYPENLLDIYTSMFANTTWLTYALFTFQYSISITRGPVLTLMSELPRAFINQKLLMFTVPFVIYGVMRYLQLIYDQDKGESPAEVILKDKPILITVGLWGFLVIAFIYGIS
jgi:decaprenyl-phosphate phosphoribosyltransferase